MYAEPSPIQEPSTRITPRAVRAWQWSAALGNLVYLAIPALYVALNPLESRLAVLLAVLFFLLALALWIAGTFWLPWLRWKRWRYSIDRNEIDLKRGILIKQRTLIPLNRVQHVDTRQGPILRYYGLAAVTISTAATTHEIPALDEETADLVRDRISRFARLAEEDV
ncbi:MAG: PH domain-containing protein [Balneolaceae bacterium]